MSKPLTIHKTDHCETNVAHKPQIYSYQFSRNYRRRRHFYVHCAVAKETQVQRPLTKSRSINYKPWALFGSRINTSNDTC